MRARASGCPQEASPLLDPTLMGLRGGTPGGGAAAGQRREEGGLAEVGFVRVPQLGRRVAPFF